MKIIEILSAVGVLALLAEIFRFKKFLLPIVLIGLLGAIASAIKDWNTNIHYYHSMLTFDNYALLFSIVLCGTAFLWILSSQNYLSDEHLTDKTSLAIFSLIGAVIIVSYSNMVMLFLGVEILSIPLYVLAGSKKENLFSNEAALKYFLMGAFATGFLLFGIAMIYGATGSFDINIIGTVLNSTPSVSASLGEGSSALVYCGILLMLCGISFKASAVPFHFWAPDVYQGSPTSVTAFMASIVKTAAFAAFLRLFMTCFFNLGNVWVNIVCVMAGATILLGNITAVYQSSVKRMLAYSSIAHAGYLMLAILSKNSFSAGAVLYYAAAYSVSTIASFTILGIIERQKANDETQVMFEDFAGLAKRNPLLAFAMTISMLSLAGIPPLAGFFGKYYLFSSVLQSGYVWIVLIAVLGSLIGVYYYFRVIIKMYMKGATEETSSIEISLLQKIVLVIAILLTILIGIFPELLIGLL